MKRTFALWIATMILVPLAVVGLLTIAVLGWSFWAGLKHEESIEVGRSFGRSATDTGCFSSAADAMLPTSRIPGVPPEASWLRGCLLAAQRTDELCAGVPHPSDPAAETWIDKRCEEDSLPQRSCSQRYWMLQHHCAGWLDDPEEISDAH